MHGENEIARKADAKMTTNQTIKLDREIRAFLRECLNGQCLGIAAWAARILKAGEMAMTDLERCINLGFEF